MIVGAHTRNPDITGPNEADAVQSISCTHSQYVSVLAGMPPVESCGAVEKFTGLGKQEGEGDFVKIHVVENVPDLGMSGKCGILLVNKE